MEMLEVQPLKNLTKQAGLWKKSALDWLVYFVGAIHLIYMICFTWVNIHNRDWIKEHFVDSGINTSSNATRASTSSNGRSMCWVIEPILLIIIQIFYWIAGNASRPILWCIIIQFLETFNQQYFQKVIIYMRYSPLSTVTCSIITDAILFSAYLVLMLNWCLAWDTQIATGSYSPLTRYVISFSALLLVGWSHTITFYNVAYKVKCSIEITKLVKVIFETLTSPLFIWYVLLLVGASLAMHVLNLSDLNTEDYNRTAWENILVTLTGMEMLELTTHDIDDKNNFAIDVKKAINSLYICATVSLLVRFFFNVSNEMSQATTHELTASEEAKAVKIREYIWQRHVLSKWACSSRFLRLFFPYLRHPKRLRSARVCILVKKDSEHVE